MQHPSPQLNVEILEQFSKKERIDRLDSVLNQRTSTLRILLENIQNDHNISAVIRSADAFGIQHLHLVGDKFEYSRGITMGTERWLSIHQHCTIEEALIKLKELGYKLVILQPEQFQTTETTLTTIPVFDLPFHEKLVLAFGNERDGISLELARKADLHAFIPMFGFVDSLNISVAAAISMFCSTIVGVKRERQVLPISEEERLLLRKEWLITSVRNSEIILEEIERRRRS